MFYSYHKVINIVLETGEPELGLEIGMTDRLLLVIPLLPLQSLNLYKLLLVMVKKIQETRNLIEN